MTRFVAPASFAQERLWFLEHMGLVGSAYHVMSAFRLEGPVDIELLERSVTTVIARHEALRTTFETIDGRPMQVVQPPWPFAFAIADLANDRAGDRPGDDEVLREQALAEATIPFDLTRGPLVRGRLVRLSSTHHIGFFTLHHIVADGWSMGVLIREIGAAYAAFSAGRTPAWPALPLQYADYAAWQREWLQGEVVEQELHYWRTQLADAPEGVRLPTDRPRRAVQRAGGARVDFHVPRDVVRALRHVSREAGATLFMSLLAAFKVLLARYTGQTDLVVGSPIANRTQAETKGLIGFFVNTLVLRTQWIGDPSFQTVLQQVKETCLGAYAHQALPFERLVEALAPGRDLSRTPLFQIMFVLQNAPMPPIRLAGVRLRPVLLPSVTSKFDLTCTLAETPATAAAADARRSRAGDDGLSGGIEFSTDLFDEATIAQLGRHFVAMLRAAAATPDAPISTLSILDADERRYLVDTLNATATGTPPVDGPAAGGVAALFDAQAVRTPDAPALMFGNDTLSYAALDARASRVASALRRLGVSPDTAVGILASRSIDTIVAVLGTLKAGGAYLPLDPAYPADRLSFMLADAGAPLLLAPRDTPLPPVPASVSIVAIEDLEDLHRDESGSVSGPAIDADHLAYIIYTSGSTGRPKGVAMPHGPLVGLTRWQLRVAPPAPGARTLQFSSLSFDASFQEMLTTWATGGTLCLIGEDERRNPEALLTHLHEQRIHRLFCPFVALKHLAQAAERRPDLSLDLREICAAGEALEITPEIAAFFARHPHCRLHNFYGPSETHVVTAHALRGDPATWPPLPPIGTAIERTRIYLLDDHLTIVPIGVAGELYVGGLPLARGYLHRPDATADRFLPDPCAPDAGGRMSRTGDLARRLRDGTIEFLGRVDQQVKIRGFRVEPGEIEAVLARHPAVGQAAVIARADRGQTRLIAFVVPSSPSERVNAAALRTFLKQHVPDYMVPSTVMTIAALPRTASGKIDRRALPEPVADVEDRASLVPPRNGFEEALAEIFCDLLRLPRVGVHDDFFALGGHSLLATQVVARVRQVLDAEISVRAVFETPTIAGLAVRIASAREAGVHSPAPPLVRRAVSSPVPLSFAQERLWFLDQMGFTGSAYHLTYALRLDGALDTAALERSVSAVTARHDALRTTFETIDGRPVQVVHPPSAFEFVSVDLAALDASARDASLRDQAIAEARLPFDLTRGPLVRGRLVRLSPTQHLGFFTLHHIVADGWSMGVLIREIGAGYAAFSSGRTPAWPALPLQYADYAAWQREWLQGEVVEQELHYWRTQLADAPEGVRLPTDRPRPAVPRAGGARVDFHVPRDVVHALHRVSREAGATLFMTLLAAFKVLLARYTGQTDLVVGSPIANRTQAETEALIGFFVNTLVLRTRWTGDPSFKTVLKQVKETCLGAYAHQALPFERLVEALAPGRDPSRTPLFQIMFLLQNAPMSPLELGGLTLTPWPQSTETAKFDVTLALTEGSDGLTGTIHYSRDLFDEHTIAALASRFCRIVAAIAADPEQRISALPMLTDEERQQIVAWSATDPVAPPESFAAAVHMHVARTPDAIAVQRGARRLTYAELDARTDRLASALAAEGVGPDVCVAVCHDVSLAIVVSLVAVLKAGGAFVPLDPRDPIDRRMRLIEDARCRVLLTTDRIVRTATPVIGGRVRVIDVEALLDEPLDARVPRPLAHGLTSRASARPASADRLAYVIYTSGSTGVPKGVMVSEASLLNYLAWVNRVVLRGRPVAATTSPTFDASLKQLLAPLIDGRTVWIPEAGNDFAALPDEWHRMPESLFNGPPAVWEALLRQLEADPTRPGPAAILLGGDALPASLLERTRRRLPALEVWNLYGPTEATANAAADRIDRIDAGAIEPTPRVTIGRPVGGARLHVLDRWMQPLPPNVPGDLYIGGVGLARGYLGAPDLTADRFVPDPFDAAGGRLYRTGDRARLVAGGRLEFLGRIDDEQIKIRGFRVELGEIEAALQAHPGVRAAAVTCVHDRGRPQLVAHVVATSERLAPRDVQEALARQLPHYMVPSHVRLLTDLPVGRHGKVDRQALIASIEIDATSADARVHDGDETSLSPIASTLLAIWRELLGRRTIGPHDNFFEIGGDSILSIQVVARARQAGMRLTPRDLFERQTIAELTMTATFDASLVAPDRDAAAASASPSAPRAHAATLTPIQQRFVMLDVPERHHYNQAIWIVLSRRFDAGAWTRAIAALADRHDVLRLTCRKDGDGDAWRADVRPSLADGVLQVIDQTHDAHIAAEARAAARDAIADAWQRRFDLAIGPLLRVLVFDEGAAETCRVCLIAHHLIVDAVSWRVLVDDLCSALTQADASVPRIQLPTASASVHEWAERLRHTIAREDADALCARWQTRLPADGLVPLPLDANDTDRGPNVVGSAEIVAAHVDAALTRDLLERARTARLSIEAVLLAAVSAAVCQWSGADAVQLDVERHGREPSYGLDLSRTVGWFTAIVPVRCVASAPDLWARARAIQQQLDDDERDGHDGHYLFLRYAHPDDTVRRRMAALPASSILINYLGAMGEAAMPAPIVSWDVVHSESLRDASTPRSHLLELTAGLRQGALHVAWTFSGRHHRRETIARLQQAIATSLQDACEREPAPRALRAADFPLAGLTQEQLDAIQARLIQRTAGSPGAAR